MKHQDVTQNRPFIEMHELEKTVRRGLAVAAIRLERWGMQDEVTPRELVDAAMKEVLAEPHESHGGHLFIPLCAAIERLIDRSAKGGEEGNPGEDGNNRTLARRGEKG